MLAMAHVPASASRTCTAVERRRRSGEVGRVWKLSAICDPIANARSVAAFAADTHCQAIEDCVLIGQRPTRAPNRRCRTRPPELCYASMAVAVQERAPVVENSARLTSPT